MIRPIRDYLIISFFKWQVSLQRCEISSDQYNRIRPGFQHLCHLSPVQPLLILIFTFYNQTPQDLECLLFQKLGLVSPILECFLFQKLGLVSPILDVLLPLLACTEQDQEDEAESQQPGDYAGNVLDTMALHLPAGFTSSNEFCVSNRWFN